MLLRSGSAWLVTASALAMVAIVACSEATDGLVPPGRTVDASADGSSGSSGSSGGGPPRDAGGSTSTGLLLINEISGEDWVEIVNAGTASMDLSGFTIADADKTSGDPKPEDGATFPEGTKLAPKAYGIVMGGGVDAGIECPSGGQAFCFHAEFGITKDGEPIFLLAPDGAVAGKVDFPAGASDEGKTWARVPDGDPNGEFTVTDQTPGAANKRP